MIEHLPAWINLLFIASSIFTIGIFFLANGKPKTLIGIIIVWSVIQSILSYLGFYQVSTGFPPRFVNVLLPTILLIAYGLRAEGIQWVDQNRHLTFSTLLHIVRIPVEIVLLYLFFHKMVPELMTFEGRNFDIIAGLSAPIICLVYLKKKISDTILIGWNIIGLILVSFILVNGLLSAELPIQQFGFEQPNKAINYFPFILLPATIVPIVWYTHLTDIIYLLRKRKAV